jgi:signal transduction histidine kinase
MEAELSLNQRMASLGTLSAGLAHELNNPSAAVRRSADQLRAAFERWKALGAEMGALTLAQRERDIIDGLLAAAESRIQAAMQLDPLERAEREEALEEWLGDCSVERAWELAATLVDAGLGEADLAPLRSGVPQEHLSTILWWTATGGVIAGLLAELAASAGSISAIVAAVKSYTHLDQAPVQEIDVHAGLDQTLMIMRHELRQVHVRREYAPDLPRITAWPSELNQVWTNLISNAVDAMEGHGELTIRTRCADDWVIVEIEDNGPGIPIEIQPRLFDPFFTTKGPGRGTGLGLHISYNIVTQKHRGTIRVFSHPGQTTFEVSLPVELHPS